MKNDYINIDILGHKVKVQYVNPDSNKLILDGQQVIGLCSPRTQSILIANNLSPLENDVCFYHEVLHYIDWILNDEKFMYSEECINKLARGLATLKKI